VPREAHRTVLDHHDMAIVALSMLARSISRSDSGVHRDPSSRSSSATTPAAATPAVPQRLMLTRAAASSTSATASPFRVATNTAGPGTSRSSRTSPSFRSP
jgi:hypothetical protein